jgi:hypothetical protein
MNMREHGPRESATVEDVPDSSALRGGLAHFESSLAPALASVVRLVERVGRGKALGKQTGEINRLSIVKQLEELARGAADLAEHVAELQVLVDGFRMAVTDEDRDAWTRVFVESCHDLGRHVESEYPLFRVFPVEVRADLADDAISLNGRTVRVLHPKAVADLVNKEIVRLTKERFNVSQFMRALARAYDLLMAERRAENPGKRVVPSAPLRQIYALLAIRTGMTATNGYPLNQFAFDLYRLRSQRDVPLVVEGRRLVFEQTRVAREVVSIPLPGGEKELLGSLELVEVGSGGGEGT